MTGLPVMSAVAAAPLIGAMAMSPLVEFAHAVVPLGRTCAVVDVVDSTSGVLLGMALGPGVYVLCRRVPHGVGRRRPRRP
jgi:VanZ family protein